MKSTRTAARSILLTLGSVTITGCAHVQVAPDNTATMPASDPAVRVVPVSSVTWDQLNAARGDQSPKAATLWGDRNGSEATGFLFKPVDGFESPPHIHNVAYRGVVIDGLIHNDDPQAEEMWMPAGSFWTQPAGEVHITAATGGDILAYIEIESGPYLVLPTGDAFDSGERPVNVDASNIVWLDGSNLAWIDQPGGSTVANGPKVAFLWGSPRAGQLRGTLVKLPGGMAGEIRSQGSTFRAVVIEGEIAYRAADNADPETLGPGSYFSGKTASVHRISATTDTETVLYVRTDGRFDIHMARIGE